MTHVKMNVDGEVRDWGRFQFMDENSRVSKSSLNEYYNMVASIYRRLPQAGIFVTESQFERIGKSIAPEKQMLVAILYTMLSFGEPEQPKVVQINSNAVTKHFGLNMGHDRVSCQDLFRELVRSQEIKIPPQLEPKYDRQSKVDKEFLGLNTLYCLAFWKATEHLKAEKKSLS